MKPKSRTSSYFNYITLFYLTSILQKINQDIHSYSTVSTNTNLKIDLLIISFYLKKAYYFLRAGTLT